MAEPGNASQTIAELRARRGAAIKAKREAADLSQRALAMRAGITNSTVADIEKGLQSVSDQTLVALAEALNCEVHELFTSPDVEAAEAS